MGCGSPGLASTWRRPIFRQSKDALEAQITGHWGTCVSQNSQRRLPATVNCAKGAAAMSWLRATSILRSKATQFLESDVVRRANLTSAKPLEPPKAVAVHIPCHFIDLRQVNAYKKLSLQTYSANAWTQLLQDWRTTGSKKTRRGGLINSGAAKVQQQAD